MVMTITLSEVWVCVATFFIGVLTGVVIATIICGAKKDD